MKNIPLLIVSLVTLWTGAFAAECVITFRDVYRWHTSLDRVEQLRIQMSRHAAEIASAVQTIQGQTKEAAFLQGLVDVLPQEKKYVRTERVVSDEVSLLRAKVAHRLHNDLHVLVDTRANKLFVKQGVRLLWEADCSVGRGGVLFDRTTGRRWEFVTPRGQFEVLSKMENPLWTKPDWAFVENGEPVPLPDDPKRKVPGELGAFVLNLGDGYLIHGTKDERVLGHSVSHGCVRLGAEDLKKLYQTIPRGARVFIY